MRVVLILAFNEVLMFRMTILPGKVGLKSRSGKQGIMREKTRNIAGEGGIMQFSCFGLPMMCHVWSMICCCAVLSW